MTSRWRFAFLYFSEGAPIGFVWWALPTLLRNEGVALERITALTAALTLPWALKFIWAPLVDIGRGPRWGFRQWAMSAQLGMGLALLPLCFIDPVNAFGWWFTLLLVHAVCASTQDVAIDAMAVSLVSGEERGRLNAAMQVGMLGGRSLFGGGAIGLAATLGWGAVIGSLVIAIWLSLWAVWTLPEPSRAVTPDRRRQEFGRSLRAVARARSTWVGLGFALVAGAGFEALGALAGPWFTDLGVPLRTIGWFFAIPMVGSMAMGGWLGGRWVDAGNRRQRLGRLLLGLTGAMVLLGWVVVVYAPAPMTLMIALVAIYAGMGAFTAASYAWFMDLTDPRLGATHFSTFMAATNGCEVWAVGLGGWLAARFDYGPAFVFMALAGSLGLLLLRVSPTKTKQSNVESR